MAVAAVHLGHVAQVNGVLEADLLHRRHAQPALFLAEHAVAGLAVLGDDLAVGADVLPVVAAEAAVEVEVADVVGMRAPVELHFGEERELVDALDFFDGAANFGLIGFQQVGVLGLVEGLDGLRDALYGGVGGVVLGREGGDGCRVCER